MVSFEKILLRLKESLSIQKDKDVAEVLGMSPTAFNGRKKRGLFPEDKLLALIAKRPDLRIDVNYVLTGKPSSRMTRAEAKRLGILKPDIYVSQTLASVEDDGDESQDEEPFTMNTPATYRLSKDEWELMQRFRVSSLETKMEVMKILMSVDMSGKTDDEYKPESNKNKSSGINVTGNGNRVAGRNYNERKK